jgi:hypothetical protein
MDWRRELEGAKNFKRRWEFATEFQKTPTAPALMANFD